VPGDIVRHKSRNDEMRNDHSVTVARISDGDENSYGIKIIAIYQAKRRHNTGNGVTGAAECGRVLAAGAPRTQKRRRRQQITITSCNYSGKEVGKRIR